MKEELENIKQWTQDLKLTLNVKKTKSLFIKKTKSSTAIEFAEVSLVREHKILGITWSDDLSWRSHVETMTRTFSQRLYCLRVLKPCIEKDELMQIYNSLLRSLLEYCSLLLIGMLRVISEGL